MDRARLTEIAHRGLLFWNPVTPEAMDALVATLELRADDSLLDVGCGRGELLLRAASRWGVRGVGVDPHPGAMAIARAEAASRGLADRTELREEAFDAGRWADGAFDAAACVGATHAAGLLDGVLRAFGRLVRVGGAALIGEGYWRCDPDPEYLAVLGADPGELRSLDAVRDVFGAAGFEIAAEHLASEDDWTRYEEAWAGNVELDAVERPDDPEAPERVGHVRRRLAVFRSHGRSTLGFGVWVARRAPTCVRPAVAADWPEMRRAFVAAGRAAWSHILAADALAQLAPPARWDPAQGADALVAEAAGHVLAFAILRRSGDADAGPGVGEIDGFYAHPLVWGRGVGRDLLAAACDELARRGFREATLWTEARNERPRRIYERAGWTLDGTERRRTHLRCELVELRHRRRLET